MSANRAKKSADTSAFRKLQHGRVRSAEKSIQSKKKIGEKSSKLELTSSAVELSREALAEDFQRGLED